MRVPGVVCVFAGIVDVRVFFVAVEAVDLVVLEATLNGTVVLAIGTIEIEGDEGDENICDNVTVAALKRATVFGTNLLTYIANAIPATISAINPTTASPLIKFWRTKRLFEIVFWLFII